MHFDRLAHAVEHHFPQYVETVKDARLFRVAHAPVSNAKPAGVALVEWEPETKLIENFRLPFKTVAVENATDRHSTNSDRCVLFQTINETERTLRFLAITSGERGAQRFATGECMIYPDGVSQQGRIVHLTQLYAWDIMRKKATKINVSPSLIDPQRDQTRSELSLGPLSRAERERQLNTLHADMARLTSNLLHMIIITGVLEVTEIIEPSTFILEERPLKEDSKQSNTIIRSHCRPHYIVLKPQEIRRRLGLPEPTGTTKTPHERRGHWRQLLADRYKEKKKIWVRDSWIGPREAIVGKNRYLVLLGDH